MSAAPAVARATLALVFASAALAGCYTLQAVRGQLEVLAARRPLDAVRDDPATDAATRRSLAVAAEARDLARAALGLDGGSYRSFVRLDREWPLWNLVVAPELASEPRRQCFVLVGCLDYRGFFDAADAARAAARARDRGDDAWLAPVPAYSTLGWFDDPVLWSMLRWDDATLAAMIGHELAHESLHTGDDGAFAEAYAETVGAAVVRRLFATPERAAALAAWEAERARQAAVQATLLAARAELAAVYAGALDAEAKRAAKRRVLARLAQDPGGEWNNARLALVATYAELQPGFEALLAEEGGDLARLRARAAALARLAPAARHAALRAAAAAQRPNEAREAR